MRVSPLSYVELSIKNLVSNVREIRNYIGRSVEYFAVVKANAYGHGMRDVVKVLSTQVDGFQVDDIEELREIRGYYSGRVMVLGFVPVASLAEVVKLKGEPAIYDALRIQELEKIGLKCRVHLKLETGLGRQGIMEKDLPKFVRLVRNMKTVKVVSAYSHFSEVKGPDNLGYAKEQIENFAGMVKYLRDMGLDGIKTHLSATSGTLLFENGLLKNDYVRVGAGTYGIWPSDKLKKKFGGELKLRGVLRLVSHLAQVKEVNSGMSVGYGRTYVTGRRMKLGVVPLGYSDGVDRKLSNCGEVLIGGRRCPMVGVVSMNMFTVDVTGVKGVAAEGEVVVIGKQGDDEITPEEVAEKIGTINYEVVTRISPLLPRVLV